MHKVPCNVVRFNNGKDDKNPVKDFHTQEHTHQTLWFDDSQHHFDGRYDREEDEYPPNFLNIDLNLIIHEK